MSLPPDGGDLTPDGTTILRRHLTAAGWDWCPEYPKKIGAPDWPSKCGQWDPEETYQGKYGPLLNTGLYLNGVAAVDLDVDHPEDVREILQFALSCLGMPRCARTRPNSPRCALLYRIPNGDGLTRSIKGSLGGVEILTGERAKLTAFGVHTDKVTQVRSRLAWDEVPGNVAKADLGEVIPAQLDRFLGLVAGVLGQHVATRVGRVRDQQHNGAHRPMPTNDPEVLRAAMNYVANDGKGDWHDWNKIGMALFSAFAGSEDGLAEFIGWTEKGGHNAAPCIERWARYQDCPPTAIGAGTLFHRARQGGFVIPPPSVKLQEQRLADAVRTKLLQKNVAAFT